MQGHNRVVVENATISSLVKQVFTLDPLYKKEDLDGVKLPRTNLRPDLVPELMQELPRVIYHSCDRMAMETVIEHGLIPAGWPNRTGRAHNFFIASHPWDEGVGGKKLGGTRAGKQFTSPSTPSWSCRMGAACSAQTKPSSAQTGLATSVRCALMTRPTENSPGSTAPTS